MFNLKEIGLSANEETTYNALLELGDSTRAAIVKKTGIAGSKIYDVLERLQTKGLVSIYLKDKVKHFKPQHPKQLINYLEEKENRIKNQKEELEKDLPKLAQVFLSTTEEQEVELLSGLKSLQLYFNEQIEELKKGELNYVIGGTKGVNEEHIIAFFRRVHNRREEKGIKTKMLYNKRQEKAVNKEYSKKEFPNSQTKFISHNSAVSINIHKNKVLIIIFGKSLTGIKITSQDVADSFLEYFNILWQLN